MSFTEPIGYLASALVLATFCMRDMGALRWMAIASNLVFVAYGVLAGLDPVLVLHLVLLPLNLARLREARAAQRQGALTEAAIAAKPELHAGVNHGAPSAGAAASSPAASSRTTNHPRSMSTSAKAHHELH